MRRVSQIALSRRRFGGWHEVRAACFLVGHRVPGYRDDSALHLRGAVSGVACLPSWSQWLRPLGLLGSERLWRRIGFVAGSLLSARVWWRVVCALGVSLMVVFLPQSAWAASSVSAGDSAGVLAQDQAQMIAYSTPPSLVELESGQFAVFVLALGVLITLVAAALVLEMRR